MKFYRLCFIIVLFFNFTEVKSQLFISQQKYTSTALTVYNVNSSCYGSGLEMYVNNVKVTNFTYGLCNFGICQFRYPFGTFKVGDVLTVKDVCGNSTAPMYIEDDFVYVEVPNGTSYAGNNINATDESLPYSRLSTPLNVGKCENIPVNSHALHIFDFFVGTGTSTGTFSTGVIKLNGSPLSASAVRIEKIAPTTTIASITNGVITYNGTANLFINQNFSGRTTTTIEYTHNGQYPSQDMEFGLGPLRVRMWNPTLISVYDYRYDGSVNVIDFNGSYANANVKITFDLGFFKVFVNNVELYSIRRSVIYSASSGSLSNTSLLDYATGVTWTPGSSGVQWVGALVDGVRFTRQNFNVSEDISLNQTVTNVACNGQATGSVTINATGGQNPLQYSKDGVSFSSNNTFSSLTAGNYTFYVKDASGCQTSKGISVSENSALGISVNSKTNANCDGQANGSVMLSATGGAGFYEFGYEDAHYQSGTTISNLVSGNYQFWVKDAAGCKKSIDDVIGLNSSLKANILSKQNLLCFNDNTGNVTLENSGAASGTIKYSKDGLIFQSSPTFSSLSSGNYTFTLKDDICSSSIATNISEPTQLSLTGNIDNQVSCFGGNNAKITVSQNGGTSPYTFSADDTNYSISNVFDNLAIGNYKYWVKDNNGCKANTPIYSITQPTDLIFSVNTKTDISCFGGSDGTVNLISTGGVPSYQFTIDNINYQNSQSFSGLNAGIKTFGVRDQNGCKKTLNSTLLQATVFNLNISLSKNLICNNDLSGSVTLAGSGGTVPYTYYKNTVNGQGTSIFNGLSAGTYVFSAKDAKNCEVVLPPSTLSEPSPIQITNILKTDVDCEIYATGALGFIATGSNGGFNFTLNGQDFKQNQINPINSPNGKFTDLKAGNYIITATDQLACTKTYTASIVPKNSNIRFNVNSTLPSTCLTADGTISVVDIIGGRPNPTYNTRISSQNAFGTQTTFTNLINGNYIITVSDDLCSYTKEVNLKVPNSLNAAYTINPVSCVTPNANVTVNPITGGSGNYELSYNGTFSNSRVFNNLAPNIYTILIRDIPLSCQTALSFEVKEQNRADLKTNLVTNISCFEGSDGYIQAIGDNNLSPFTYSFNDLSNFTPNNNFGGLPKGIYRVYAKNSIGCLDSIKVNLSQPTKIEWEVLKRDNDCFGDKTGQLTINGTGGTPPYQFAITTEYVANNFFDKLIAGKYQTSIKDAKGCNFIKETEVIQPPELVLKPIYKDTIACFGDKNGSIYIDALGGTPGYIYAIGNQNVYDTNPVYKNLGVGKYIFFVKDSKACLKETELAITEPEKLTYDLVSQKNPLCIGEKNGIIETKAAGGNTGGYTFTIDNINSQLNDGLFKDLSQGEYTFKVQDRKACFETINVVKLTWPKALSATLSQKQPVCFGDANGQISIEANGGVGGFTAEILNKNITFFEKLKNTESSFTFQKLPAGIYEFAIKDKNGCQLSLVNEIMDAVKIEDFYLPMDTTVCKEQIVKINIGNSSNRIQWFFNDSELTSTNQNLSFGSDLMVSKPGKYKVRISNTTGCEIIKSFELKNSKEALIADFLMTIQAFEGDTVYALDISKPIPDEILWTLPAEALKINQNTDGMTFKIDTEGTYTIEMLAKKGECQNIKIREIEIFKKEDIDKTSGELFYNAYYIFKSLNVFPNPNYGKFDVEVKLTKTADIEIVITRASNSVLIYKEGFTGKTDYKIPIALKNFMQDNYLLTVKVGNVVMIKRILLMN